VRRVLALVTDLMFSSRIGEQARRAGGRCESVGSVEAFLASARREPPSLAIVDLGGRSFDGVEALKRLKADPATAGIPSVAFGSHVDIALLDAARAAGCERIVGALVQWGPSDNRPREAATYPGVSSH